MPVLLPFAPNGEPSILTNLFSESNSSIGSIEQTDYVKKKELLHEKTGVKERIRRIEQERIARGSNLSMIEPKGRRAPDVRGARASKVRAATASFRHGGHAARDSFTHNSGHKAGSKILFLAVTSEDLSQRDTG